VAREAEKIAMVTGTDALAILDTHDRVFASAGRFAPAWPAGWTLEIASPDPTFEEVVVLPSGAFRVSGARLTLRLPGGEDRMLGTLVLSTSLDDAYARDLAGLARAGILIAVGDTVVGSTVSPAVARDLLMAEAGGGRSRALDGQEHVVRRLLASNGVRIYMLSSVDGAAAAATRRALRTLAAIAFGSFVLAAFASLWLARTVSAPIDRASRAIAAMIASRDFTRRLAPSGSSRELDALTHAFNELMAGITAAEAETRAAYLGAIRALAAALDARDPYTAGHSERVSALSVRIARQMALEAGEVEVIRLGALLHDVGKIGVPDSVLSKPGALTADEFEQIKRHPVLGARILREVPFLAPHLPIVELHHERPDGKGYPHGLEGTGIPLPARIVHVADAFDAITSARAYRTGRLEAAAVAELRAHAGTQFDPAVVEALAADLAARADRPERRRPALLERAS
jgi:putative nucleotidyltransferase with HDIG domain